MSNDSKAAEDLENLGLIGHSYDSLFSIRKRIRKVSDIVIPLRAGLTYSQIGIAVLVLVVQLVTYRMLVIPVFAIFDGARPPWQLLVIWVVGPTILAAQNIIKPFPYGKSIPGTVASLVRYWLDDPVHRRGMPIRTPKQPYDVEVVHFQREWVPFEEYVDDEPWEEAVSDRVTEEHISFCNRTLEEGAVIDLQEWWDAKAAEHLEQERLASVATQEEDAEEIGARRGQATRVIVPDAPVNREAGR